MVAIDPGTRRVLEKHRLAQAADREFAGPSGTSQIWWLAPLFAGGSQTTNPSGQGPDLRVCGGQGRGRTADLPIFRHIHNRRSQGASVASCNISCNIVCHIFSPAGPGQLRRIIC